ncbi:translation initiation factor IF-2-like [Dryobates pubescens]|uniref:translation initiation factor IF-2-like n=1 Tax=Dryobates pubescens TaxID=118200 RepID=UPI0023B9B9F7|nr:translation initiation factor IF-2-like [Dryobates pubescens]
MKDGYYFTNFNSECIVEEHCANFPRVQRNGLPGLFSGIWTRDRDWVPPGLQKAAKTKADESRTRKGRSLHRARAPPVGPPVRRGGSGRPVQRPKRTIQGGGGRGEPGLGAGHPHSPPGPTAAPRSVTGEAGSHSSPRRAAAASPGSRGRTSRRRCSLALGKEKLRGHGVSGTVESDGKGKRHYPLPAAEPRQGQRLTAPKRRARAAATPRGRGVRSAPSPRPGVLRGIEPKAAGRGSVPLRPPGTALCLSRSLTFTDRAALASELELPPPSWASPGAPRGSAAPVGLSPSPPSLLPPPPRPLPSCPGGWKGRAPAQPARQPGPPPHLPWEGPSPPPAAASSASPRLRRCPARDGLAAPVAAHRPGGAGLRHAERCGGGLRAVLHRGPAPACPGPKTGLWIPACGAFPPCLPARSTARPGSVPQRQRPHRALPCDARRSREPPRAAAASPGAVRAPLSRACSSSKPSLCP